MSREITSRPFINNKANALNNNARPSWVINSGNTGNANDSNTSANNNTAKEITVNNREILIIKMAVHQRIINSN